MSVSIQTETHTWVRLYAAMAMLHFGGTIAKLENMNKEEILQTVSRENIKFIHLMFSDLTGMAKSVTIPSAKLPDALADGVWFDGSSIEGFARIAESDMLLKLDPGTFAILPWDGELGKEARIICDIAMPDSSPFQGDPRTILKNNLKKLSDLGFTYNLGPECEFFLLKKTQNENGQSKPNYPLEPHDEGGYFDYTTDLARIVRREISEALTQMGIKVETSHHEVAIGQHEIDFEYANALKAADNVMTFKIVVKAIAERHNLHATFMPKPIFGINGSGMHVHQSLFLDGKNIFFDQSGRYYLSATAQKFIAGQLQHAKEMSLVLSPLVNSYKRLVPGYEAPVYIAWGQQNRSALIRIPRYIEGRPSAVRAELRCPDPACNPYLAFAVMAACGLDGIEKSLMPPEPVEENIYQIDQESRITRGIQTLPSSLGEAITATKSSDIIKNVLGAHTFDRIIEAKEIEWDEYRKSVSQWEVERYLGIY